MTFEELEIIKPIKKALVEIGYVEATPIQVKSIPLVLEGKDLLATAETGTGKTAAFALPMLQKFFENNVNHKGIRGLIIAPTRELAQQIYESYLEYSKYINVDFSVIFGGVSQKRQEKILKRKPEIVIATPGRLMDLMDQGLVDLSTVEMVVLDEADRLLDMGFVHDIDKIVSKVPKEAQTLLFSATMPKSVLKLADKFMEDPVTIKTARVSAPAETIKQSLYYVDPDNKNQLLLDLLKNEFNDSVLVFVRTKSNAERLTRFLEKEGISAAALHGDKSQNQRIRALKGFKEYKFQVLVATDVAARGIDIEKLGCVINYNIPSEAEVYVHRIGRTGRAGNVGESVSFCDYGERGLLKDVEKVMKYEINVIEDHAYPMVDTSVQPPDNRSRRSKASGSKGRGGRGGRGGSNRKGGSRSQGSRNRGQDKPKTSNDSGSQDKSSSESSKKSSGGYKGKRPSDSKGKRSEGYKGKREDSKGSRSEGYKGKRSEGYKGKREDSKGKRSEGYKGKRNDSQAKSSGPSKGSRPTGAKPGSAKKSYGAKPFNKAKKR